MRWKYAKYFSIFFLIFPKALAEYKMQLENIDHMSGSKKYAIFPRGTEFYFLYLEEFKGDLWAYVYVLNNSTRYKYAWLPVTKERKKFHFYALDKEQSFQTLQLRDAVYIRNNQKTAAYLDDKRLSSPKQNKNYEYIAKYSDIYPFTILTDIKEKILKENQIKVCSKHPKRLADKLCAPIPERYKLPKHLVHAIKKIAKEFKIDPALLAAIIHKESEFNPFSENKYEKKICLEEKKRGGKCAEYLWGQGLAQLGANNAKSYKMLWVNEMPRLRYCKKRHIFNLKCFYSLKSFCRKKYRKHKLWPNYCPVASMRYVAKHIRSILDREHKILVKSKNRKKMTTVDLMSYIKRNKAEKFRYTIGIYNRGMKPINSIEEHYRQYGKLPPWYDYAWNTKRELGTTPSSEIGFLLLYKEVINRCHVWQLAGLCGKDLSSTLVGQYRKYFNSRFTTAQKGL